MIPKFETNYNTLMLRHFDSLGVLSDVIADFDFQIIRKMLELNKPEHENMYWYHKDHLGSSTQISNIDANIIHHIEYMPSGEQFSEQRDSWATPYKFNSKELDAETGLYYYGARYYTPEIGIWLSVDPMSDKRPSLSPYNYCQLNPVMRIDPTGMLDDLYINGEDAQAAFNQLKSSTNLELSRDEKTGKIESKGVPETDDDRQLFDAINNPNVENHIKADKSNSQVPDGGGFFGNKLVKKGDRVIARTFQVVVPEKLAMLDGLFDNVGSGKAMLHEATEAHQGGLISLATNTPASPKYIGTENSIYDMAHLRSTLQPGHGRLQTGQINAAMSAKKMYQTWMKFNKY